VLDLSRIGKISRLLVALLALSIVIIAKVPTTKCKCRTKEATTESRAECPFAKLRSIAGSVQLEAASVLAPPPPQTPVVVVAHSYVASVFLRLHVAIFVRGPPDRIVRSA
jgi:hypothetical protein